MHKRTHGQWTPKVTERGAIIRGKQVIERPLKICDLKKGGREGGRKGREGRIKMPKASDSYHPISTYLFMQEPDLHCIWANKNIGS